MFASRQHTTFSCLPPGAGMTDALLKALEHLEAATQDFLLLPLEGEPLALQQQAACLQKLQAVAAVFAGTRCAAVCRGWDGCNSCCWCALQLPSRLQRGTRGKDAPAPSPWPPFPPSLAPPQRRFCFNVTLPFLGSLSVSTAVMASVAGATSLRCVHRLVRGGRD